MNSRGLTFADVLILLAIVLLLAALAIPKFVKATDYGNEEDEVASESQTAPASPADPGAATDAPGSGSATNTATPGTGS